MRCSHFLDRYSDFVDETGSAGFLAEARDHLETCPGCRRYDETFRRGRTLLTSSLDTAELDDDFHDRLQHRLYAVDERRAVARYGTGSRTRGVALLGAVVVVAGVLTPGLVAEPEVALAPIEAARPAARRPLGLRLPLPTVLPASLGRTHLELEGDDLFDRPSDLFYQYAPVRGADRARMTRAVLE
jgi:anti-sigma factor RsiW